ncbi:hypothetical protein HK102_004233 [Quaeritorhiza haematococci]|nr:hypothetical protein HK102_004233 [Quaeritorhiza haematococci]
MSGKNVTSVPQLRGGKQKAGPSDKSSRSKSSGHQPQQPCHSDTLDNGNDLKENASPSAAPAAEKSQKHGGLLEEITHRMEEVGIKESARSPLAPTPTFAAPSSSSSRASAPTTPTISSAPSWNHAMRSGGVLSPMASPTKPPRTAGKLRDEMTDGHNHNHNPAANANITPSRLPVLSPSSHSSRVPEPPQTSSGSSEPDFDYDVSSLGSQIRRDLQSPVSSATQRMCTMTQVYFLDYYFDLFTYLHQRKMRLERFKQAMRERGASDEEYAKEFKYFSGKERAHLRKRRTRMRVTNFHILTQVGQGGYGQVFLARKKDSGELCALKKMNKKLLHRLGEVQHVLTERDILTRTNTPWLVRLLYAFQDMDSLYLAMEYVPGGDFRTLLNNSGVLKEEHARFYLAEIRDPGKYLAEMEENIDNLLRRSDLKPENFLIDAEGHIKLTDFGLSRGTLSAELIESLRMKLDKVKDAPVIYRSTAERRNIYKSIRREEMQAFSLVGSPDYMAPEVLVNNNQGYGLSVDYWSLGCILFECLAGYPPFTAPTTDDVWVNVYHWTQVLERPVYEGEDEEFNFTDEAWDLITCLITNHEERYSTLQEVAAHPFFSAPAGSSEPFHIHLLRMPKGPEPPFVPQLQSELDTSYFDDFSDPSDMAMYKEVHERQTELEKEVAKREELERGPGRAGGSRGGSDEKGGKQQELRTAFLGFTFKHKSSRGPQG